MWKRSNNTTSSQALLAMGSMGILGGATPPAAYTLPSPAYYASSQPPKQETSNKLTIVLVIWAVLATCGYIYHVALPAPGTTFSHTPLYLFPALTSCFTYIRYHLRIIAYHYHQMVYWPLRKPPLLPHCFAPRNINGTEVHLCRWTRTMARATVGMTSIVCVPLPWR